MSFSDTLTLTIDGTGYNLARRNQDNFGSLYEFRSATVAITMKIRHGVDNGQSTNDVISGRRPVFRHNVLVEFVLFATPTAAEQYYTISTTLRDREASDPDFLLKFQQGFATLLATLDDDLVVGGN